MAVNYRYTSLPASLTRPSAGQGRVLLKRVLLWRRSRPLEFAALFAALNEVAVCIGFVVIQLLLVALFAALIQGGPAAWGALP